MTSPDLRPLAAEERSALLDLLRSLTPQQWETPSLCEGWSVREVAVHTVSFDALTWAQTARAFLDGRFRPGRINDAVLERYRGHRPEEVVGLLEEHLYPRGFSAGFRGGIALTDGLIHHQDIRRVLGLPRTIPEERLRPALDFAFRAPPIPAKANATGLRLVADDLDWSRGAGPEVTGPAEALLMAVTGRPDALGELGGPGLATLRARVEG